MLIFSEALSRLNVVIRHPNALQQENVMAYDNAVSALGKICQFHRDSIDSAQVPLLFIIIIKEFFVDRFGFYVICWSHKNEMSLNVFKTILAGE